MAHACPSQVDVITGDKYYQAVNFEEGKMVAGEWKRWGMGDMATCTVRGMATL